MLERLSSGSMILLSKAWDLKRILHEICEGEMFVGECVSIVLRRNNEQVATMIISKESSIVFLVSGVCSIEAWRQKRYRRYGCGEVPSDETLAVKVGPQVTRSSLCCFSGSCHISEEFRRGMGRFSAAMIFRWWARRNLMMNCRSILQFCIQ